MDTPVAKVAWNSIGTYQRWSLYIHIEPFQEMPFTNAIMLAGN